MDKQKLKTLCTILGVSSKDAEFIVEQAKKRIAKENIMTMQEKIRLSDYYRKKAIANSNIMYTGCKTRNSDKDSTIDFCEQISRATVNKVWKANRGDLV